MREDAFKAPKIKMKGKRRFLLRGSGKSYKSFNSRETRKMLKSPRDALKLPCGAEVPCLGFGTWQVPDGDSLEKSLLAALELGYRQIDTASIYANERGIGEVLRTCGVPRRELFLTDKVWNTDRGYDSTIRAFERSLALLGTDYLDLYLIHWPAAQGEAATWQAMNCGTWRALEDLYLKGRVKAIGVSNFLPHHLVPLLARARIIPMVNSIEFHPGHLQLPAVRFCREHGIALMGWAPIGRGLLLNNPTLARIAAAHGKSIPQVCLRWSLEHGVIPVVKSLSPEHLKENAEVFDFTLSASEMHEIDTIAPTAFSGLDPDHVSF